MGEEFKERTKSRGRKGEEKNEAFSFGCLYIQQTMDIIPSLLERMHAHSKMLTHANAILLLIQYRKDASSFFLHSYEEITQKTFSLFFMFFI